MQRYFVYLDGEVDRQIVAHEPCDYDIVLQPEGVLPSGGAKCRFHFLDDALVLRFHVRFRVLLNVCVLLLSEHWITGCGMHWSTIKVSRTPLFHPRLRSFFTSYRNPHFPSVTIRLVILTIDHLSVDHAVAEGDAPTFFQVIAASDEPAVLEVPVSPAFQNVR